MIVVASYVGFIGFKNSAFPSIVRFLMKLSTTGTYDGHDGDLGRSKGANCWQLGPTKAMELVGYAQYN